MINFDYDILENVSWRKQSKDIEIPMVREQENNILI